MKKMSVAVVDQRPFYHGQSAFFFLPAHLCYMSIFRVPSRYEMKLWDTRFVLGQQPHKQRVVRDALREFSYYETQVSKRFGDMLEFMTLRADKHDWNNTFIAEIDRELARVAPWRRHKIPLRYPLALGALIYFVPLSFIKKNRSIIGPIAAVYLFANIVKFTSLAQTYLPPTPPEWVVAARKVDA
jgi:hypothetical protein